MLLQKCSKVEKLWLNFIHDLHLKVEHLLRRAPRREKAEIAAPAVATNGEKERNASSGSGGNALTRGGKSIRKKIRASFRMKSTKKGRRIRTHAVQ